MSTIFDKILDGEIPCHRVYEDEHVLVVDKPAGLLTVPTGPDAGDEDEEDLDEEHTV